MMDSIIPDRRLELLQEKIDAWRETETKANENYCNIIDVLSEIADNIDGHPAEAVRILNQVKEDLVRMEDRFDVSGDDRPEKRSGKRDVLKFIGLVLSWILSTGIGILMGMYMSGK